MGQDSLKLTTLQQYTKVWLLATQTDLYIISDSQDVMMFTYFGVNCADFPSLMFYS